MNFKEVQPYRVWYQYLQTCLNDKVLSKKIDKEYYNNWSLNLVKTTIFDKWFKSHQHLFVSKGKARVVSKKTNDDSILIEIPQFYPISKIQKELPKILKGKIIETSLNEIFPIVSSLLKINYFVRNRNEFKLIHTGSHKLSN